MKKYGFCLAALVSIACMTPVLAAENHYSIVVDAGSSGSRLHVFEYQMTGGVPEIKDIFSESIKPGLSSYADHPKDAGTSLQKLLADAATELEKKHIDLHTVRVNVLATAGMRLVPEEQQKVIYASVTDFIQQHSGFTPGEIKTISGKMEGLYGWLDVNYLEGNFQHKTPTDGAIDMGGASTQISFVTQDTSKADDEVTLKIDGVEYTVFTKSFLGLGQEQARGNMDKSPDANTCYPTGYNNGHFDFNHCDALYDKLIQDQAVTKQIPARKGQHFVGFAGVFYSQHDFLGVADHPSRELVEAAISHFCTMTWDELKQAFPGQPDKYIAPACANSVYIDDLLYNTYGLQQGELTVTDKINDQAIDWTLGSVLYSLVTSASSEL